MKKNLGSTPGTPYKSRREIDRSPPRSKKNYHREETQRSEYLEDFFDENEQLGKDAVDDFEDDPSFTKKNNRSQLDDVRSNSSNSRTYNSGQHGYDNSYNLISPNNPQVTSPTQPNVSPFPYYPPYFVPYPVPIDPALYQTRRSTEVENVKVPSPPRKKDEQSSLQLDIKYLKRNVAIQHETIKDLNNTVSNLHNTVRDLVSEIRILRKELSEEIRNSYSTLTTEIIGNPVERRKQAAKEEDRKERSGYSPERSEKRVSPKKQNHVTHRVQLGDEDATESQHRSQPHIESARARLDFEDEGADNYDRANNRKKKQKSYNLEQNGSVERGNGGVISPRETDIAQDQQQSSWREGTKYSSQAPPPAKTFDARTTNSDERRNNQPPQHQYSQERTEERKYESDHVPTTRDQESYSHYTPHRQKPKPEVHSVYLESDSSLGEPEMSQETKRYMRKYLPGIIGASSETDSLMNSRNHAVSLEGNADVTYYSTPSNRKYDQDTLSVDQVRTFNKLHGSS
jgi:uncharacterized coiled-coil protein SlyX